MQFIQDACLGNFLFTSILAGGYHKAYNIKWDNLESHNKQFDRNYNHEDAKRLLELSFIASDNVGYNLPINLPDWLTLYEIQYDSCPIELISKGISKSQFNKRTTVAYILYREDTNQLFIIFVGTVNICMGALDMAYKHVEYNNISNYIPGLRGHKGIYSLYQSIRDKIISVISKYDAQVIVTGHSLGGGLSQICALDLAVYDPIHYSFAAPMVFNELGYKIFSSLIRTSYRIANGSDLVTIAPLPIMPNKDAFYHVGELIYFQKNYGDYPRNHSQAYIDEYKIITFTK